MSTGLRAAALASLFFFGINVHADERVQTYAFSSGQKLELDLNSGGSVTVVGWDQAGVELSLSDRKRDLDEYRIDVTPTADGLRIFSELIKRNGGSNLRVGLKVPRNLSIAFDSAGGSLDLSDLAGEFTGRTGGGSLTLRQLTGVVDLRTGGGRIEVSDSTLDGQVRTGGGKVEVTNVIGDLKARSGGGSVIYKNVRSASGDMRTPKGTAEPGVDPETVLIKSAGGRIKVDAAPAGARVETAGGSISVSGAERFIDARTGGGSIDLTLGEGWVRANTGAGSIDLTVLRDIAGKGDIELETGAGDVTVTLPADFSMNADIDLTVTKDARGNPTISSDFPLQIEPSDDWDYSKGSPRKHIRASGTPGGGLHRLKIRATNGNVVIRRAGG